MIRVCFSVCVWANTSRDTVESMMLLGGGVVVDTCQIFSSSSPVGTSLSLWRGGCRVGHSSLAVGLSPGKLCLFLGIGGRS